MRYCQAHFERAGIDVAAEVIVDGEPMCRACFAGKPIDSLEETGLARQRTFQARPLRRHFVCDRRARPAAVRTAARLRSE